MIARACTPTIAPRYSRIAERAGHESRQRNGSGDRPTEVIARIDRSNELQTRFGAEPS